MMMADLRSLTADICSLFSAFLISAFEHLSLALYGGIHRHAFGCFVMLAKRFPYAIYYKMEADIAIVWRVLDCRRDPGWIRTQIKTD
jgi:hypothetical protein